MHTASEYDNLQEKISLEEQKLIDLKKQEEETNSRIKELKKQKKEMVKNTIWSLEDQKLHEMYLEDQKKYDLMIEKWKEELKDSEAILLDKLTDHYRARINNLSNNRKHILQIIVEAQKPLNSKEISTQMSKDLHDKSWKITSKYISATLNWDWMYSIPKSKIYKFEVFKKTSDWKIMISDEDPYFLKWLEMRFQINKKT